MDTPITDRRRNRSDALGPAARVSTSTLKPKSKEQSTAAPAQVKRPPVTPATPAGPPMPFAAAAARSGKVSALYSAVEGDNAWCLTCAGLLYKTPEGPACDLGHTAGTGVGWEAAAMTLYDAGKSPEESALRMVAAQEDLEAFFAELDARPPSGKALDETIRQSITAALGNGQSVDAIMAMFPRVPRVVIDAMAAELGKVAAAVAEIGEIAEEDAIVGRPEDAQTPEQPREAQREANAAVQAKADRAAADEAAIQKAAEATLGKPRRVRKGVESKPRSGQVEAAPKINAPALVSDPTGATKIDTTVATPALYTSEATIKVGSREYVAKFVEGEDKLWTGVVEGHGLSTSSSGRALTRKAVSDELSALAKKHDAQLGLEERKKAVLDAFTKGASLEQVKSSILSDGFSLDELTELYRSVVLHREPIAVEKSSAPATTMVTTVEEYVAPDIERLAKVLDPVPTQEAELVVDELATSVIQEATQKAVHATVKAVLSGICYSCKEKLTPLEPGHIGCRHCDWSVPTALIIAGEPGPGPTHRLPLAAPPAGPVPVSGFVTLEAHRELEARVAALEGLVRLGALRDAMNERIAELQDERYDIDRRLVDLLKAFR